MEVNTLTTDQLIDKLVENGIQVTAEEAQKFKDNDVDGETIWCGLTESMVAELFSGSFKKQSKFIQLMKKWKEPSPSASSPGIHFEPAYPSIASRDQGSEAAEHFPAVFRVPIFPKDIQAKLDRKEACHKISKDRHKIIRVLQETMAQYTLYPSNAEYVQVAKALVLKYPFLKDTEGSGYHTWHMSLKRKFKFERAPLVNEAEVKKIKEKFGQVKKPKTQEATSCKRTARYSGIYLQGEDVAFIEQHIRVLQEQYKKTRPDTAVVHDRMAKTFSWRRKEIAEGGTVEDILKKYPFLSTPSGLCQEMDRIHPGNVCRRFQDGFQNLVPNLLRLAQGKSNLFKTYIKAREDAPMDDLPDLEFRAALVLLPTVFREKVETWITLGGNEPVTPYPTLQLLDVTEWNLAFSKKTVVTVLKMDGIEVCRASGIEEGMMMLHRMRSWKTTKFLVL
ncbi:hypothetical protein AAFF_G00437420 [Aldrovandia affinis]|uniref:Sterile alpha motif domain-containing protein 3-like n=1 Tax=Aldrovandia affinis TaxID=143900 RepID=A0AAD7WHQ1_9TELE|nr:hypothetical protein AAFF_G00437420 [Aldrovandia affinis]